MGRQKAATLIILLLAILTVGAWKLMQLRTPEQSPAVVAASSTATSPKSISIDLPLTLHHAVQGKNHSYSGSIGLPSSCNQLAAGISVQGMNPAHIRIQLSSDAIECSDSTKTTQGFELSLAGNKTPVIDAITFNGMEMPYAVVEDK